MDTTDVELADDLLRQACAAADISVSRDDPALEYSQRLDGDADLSPGSSRIRGHGRVSVQLEETVAVARVRTGCHDREVDGFRGTGLVLVQPHQSYRSTLDLVSADTVDLGLSALRRTAQDVYGEEAGHAGFDRPRTADHPRGRHTARGAEHAGAEPRLPRPPRNDAGRRPAGAAPRGRPRGPSPGGPRHGGHGPGHRPALGVPRRGELRGALPVRLRGGPRRHTALPRRPGSTPGHSGRAR